MYYRYIKFIAVDVPLQSQYTINCFLKNYTNKKLLKSFITERSCFTNTAATEEDLRERVQVFLQCLEEIRTQTQNLPPQTLKIIVFPEFVFRPFFGAYTLGQVEKITTIIRVYLNSPPWQDFLVFYSLFAAAQISEEFYEENLTYEAYNFCYIQKGNCGLEGSRLVMKEQMSNRDAIKLKHAKKFNIEKPLLNDNTSHLHVGKFVQLSHTTVLNLEYGINQEQQKNGADHSGKAIFDIDNIKFGVEICLDHQKQRLRRSPNTDKQIQIQILMGAGMQFTPRAIVAATGGYVFYNDIFLKTNLYKKTGDTVFFIVSKEFSIKFSHPFTPLLFATDKIKIVHYPLQEAPPSIYSLPLPVLQNNSFDYYRDWYHSRPQSESLLTEGRCFSCKSFFLNTASAQQECGYCTFMFCTACSHLVNVEQLNIIQKQYLCMTCIQYLNIRIHSPTFWPSKLRKLSGEFPQT